MMVAISGMVFILLTALFGVTVNTMTGQVDFSFEPGSDWSNPMVDKPSETTFKVNPAKQYPDWIFLSMILGYFISVGLLCQGWFSYQKWRWLNIPVKERYEEKIIKTKIPNNTLYKIEMMERRTQQCLSKKK
jgi:hypothetical protein